ncbi:MAG: WG repeat-containing protein [Bacteroidales bacterium]|nr:WG repeat-containing protein [Bacteroidales bacterium]
MKKILLAILILTYAGCLSAQTPSLGNNGKYGFVQNGNVVIPYIYEYASDFNDGLAVVCKSSKFGFIDRTGQTVIPFEYKNSHAIGFSEGVCGVTRNGKKWFFIDKSGNRISDKEYSCIMPYKSGMAAVYIDDNTAVFVDKSGRQVIDAEFAYAETFHDGIAVAGKLDSSRSRLIYGFIDTKGNWLSNSFYDEIHSEIGKSPFETSGIVMVRKGNRTGYVNRQMQFFESLDRAVASSLQSESNAYKKIFDFECGKFYRITHTDWRTEKNRNPELIVELSIELAWVSVGESIWGCVMTWGDENGADQIDVYSFSKREVVGDGIIQYSNDEGDFISVTTKEDGQGVCLVKPKDNTYMIYLFDTAPLSEPFVKREFRETAIVL